MTTSPDYKVRENRARRAADRQGLELKKNARRDPRAADFGSYLLVDKTTGWVVADFGWDCPGFPDGPDWLADVEAHLSGAAGTSRIKPAREARALAAEWVDQFRRTDTAWCEPYSHEELAQVNAALDSFLDTLPHPSESLFHRLASQAKIEQTSASRKGNPSP